MTTFCFNYAATALPVPEPAAQGSATVSGLVGIVSLGFFFRSLNEFGFTSWLRVYKTVILLMISGFSFWIAYTVATYGDLNLTLSRILFVVIAAIPGVLTIYFAKKVFFEEKK